MYESEYPLKISRKLAKIVAYVAEKHRVNGIEIHKSIKIPRSTVYLYLEKYFGEEKPIKLKAVINPQKLGLKQALLYLKRAKRPLLEKIINRELIDYWIYYTKVYDGGNWDFFVYNIPMGNNQQFVKLIDMALENELVDSYKLEWVIGPHIIKWGFKWFKNGKMIYDWDSWVEEIETSSEELPESLKETAILTTRLDKLDIQIMSRIERDITFLNYSEMSRHMKASRRAIKRHYENHLRARGLFSTIFIALPAIFKEYEKYLFDIEFPDEKTMGKFINSMSGKPFGVLAYRIVDITMRLTNSVRIAIIFPPRVLLGFLKTLDKLKDEGMISRFRYSIVDPVMERIHILPYDYIDPEILRWKFNFDQWRETLLALPKK